MKNHYVVDTSVLIQDPSALKKLVGDVTLPLAVIEELDKLKKQAGETGRNARQAIRQLDELRNPHVGCKVNKAFIKIDTTHFSGKEFGDSGYGDNRILSCIHALHNKNLKLTEGKRKRVVLLSGDLNLRIRARSGGIEAEEHSHTEDVSELYSGIRRVKDEVLIQKILETGTVETNGKDTFKPNECLILQDEAGHDITLARKMADGKIKIVKRPEAWNILPRSPEQTFAMDMMFDPTVPLVSLIGKAGSGKTLLALACALELVLTKKKYNKIVIYRPIQVFGNDIGFIPGTELEKLMVHAGPILDGFELLFTSSSKNQKGDGSRRRNWKDDFELFIDKGVIEVSALAYIRGRSISNALIIVDEAQNLDASAAKTILTRIGTGSKIIITGDVEQIDNGKLDAENNMISKISDAFKGSKLAGHVTFEKCERSELASEAIKLL